LLFWPGFDAGFSAGELKHEVAGESLDIAFDGLIERFDPDAVQLGEVLAQQDPFPSKHKYQGSDVL
jgi:hypothetical protein